MPKSESFKFWILSHRFAIGSVILGLAGIFRVTLVFQGHSEVADTLKGIADLFMLGGGAAAAAGAMKPDEHYREKKQAAIRERSGQYPVFTRRKEDRRPEAAGVEGDGE